MQANRLTFSLAVLDTVVLSGILNPATFFNYNYYDKIYRNLWSVDADISETYNDNISFFSGRYRDEYGIGIASSGDLSYYLSAMLRGVNMDTYNGAAMRLDEDNVYPLFTGSQIAGGYSVRPVQE